MPSQLTAAVAAQQVREVSTRLSRAAASRTADAPADVVLRLAGEADADALTRLAQLETRRPLRGPVLLALVDGRPAAAVELTTGDVAADPFQRTADVVRLLCQRREQLLARPRAPRAGRPRLARLGWR